MKLIKFFACFSAALISLQACNKADDSTTDIPVTVATQTIDATVEKNGTYRVVLPSSVSGYVISSETAHATVSKIVTENGNEIYEYTPEENYVGSDALVITGTDTTGTEGHEGGCNKGNRPPKRGAEPQQRQVKQQVLNININVTEPTTTS